MFRRLQRHIKDGFLGVKRHFGMAISSASAVTITLVLVGVFLVLTANLASLSKEIEDSISLTVLIDYSVTDKQEIEKIEKKIYEIEAVSNVDYRTKDEEFDFYSKTYPEMAEFNEYYRDQNPFHDAYLVKVKDGETISAVKEQIANISGVDSVEDGGDNTYILVDLLHKVRIFGAGLVLALCVLAVYLIYNTINITISSRTNEIWIMRNVGAKNSYIRAPFLVEGIIIGIMGSIVPIAMMVGLYMYLFDYTGGILVGVITLLPVFPFILYMSAVLLGIGVIVGLFGSYISVSKYLRFKR